MPIPVDDPRPALLAQALATDPDFHDLLAAARSRYVSTGSWVVGRMLVSTPPLRQAAKDIGCAIRNNRVHLRDLDTALGRTRYRCTLEEACRWVFGAHPSTRAEERASAAATWLAARSRVLATADAAALEVEHWLDADQGLLRGEWARDAAVEAAAVLAARAAAASLALTEPKVVPALANRVAGDPHALDVGTTARRYFERILRERHAELALPTPLTADARAELLAASNLAADAVSSFVFVLGLASADPLLATARATGQVIGLPLMTLATLRDLRGAGDVAFAVENRSIFSMLVRSLDGVPPMQQPTLVCTSGQPSLAARVLLERLSEAGATIYYGGDTDAAGLKIADRLGARIGNSFRRWRMAVPAGEVRFQESVLAELAEDLQAFVRQRTTPPA